MSNNAIPDIAEITGVILAGGKGSRLSSAVSDRPKVLAEICGRPFLTFLLDQLVSAGLKQVILCTGYMAEEIRKEIGASYKSLQIIHSPEYTPLGTAGAARNALKHLRSDMLILMNGDSFCEVDFNAYWQWYFKKDREAALLLTHVENSKRYGKVAIAADEAILSFQEKDQNSNEYLINAGIYIFHKELLTSIPPERFYSLEHDFLPNIIGSGIYGYCCHGNFIDIGTPESYRFAEDFFQAEN